MEKLLTDVYSTLQPNKPSSIEVSLENSPIFRMLNERFGMVFSLTTNYSQNVPQRK